MLVALQILFSIKKGFKASKLLNEFKPIPQVLKNIKVKNKSIIYSKICKKAINTTKNLIKNKGRILVRASGTENKIRIMVESENKILIKKCINLVARSIKN